MEVLHDVSRLPAIGLALLLLAALMADVHVDLRRLVSGRSIVLLGIAAWYLLEALMLPAALRRHNQAAYNQGILGVALALAAFLAGYHYTEGCALFPAFGRQIAFFEDRTWLWRLVLFGAVIGFAPVVVNVGFEIKEMFDGMFGGRATWGGLLGRGRYGDARAAFLMLEMFVAGVAPFAAILLLDRGTTLHQRVTCLLIVTWPIMRGFGSGTRSALIQGLAPLLAIFYWKAKPALQARMVLVALLLSPLFYGLMAAMVASRNSGSFSWEAQEQAEGVGNEMFRELLFICNLVPDQADYQYGYSYYVQLVNPIPRFLWPGKPTLDTGILMAQLYGEVDATGEATLTVSPGLIGEMYLNFGWLGIAVLSCFGGWLVKGWDRILKEQSHSLVALLFYSAGLGVLFVMGRSFTMGMFYGLLSFALLAWIMRQFSSGTDAKATAPA